MSCEIGRRDLIKLTAGAALVSQTHAAGKLKFFIQEEFELVDELTELIIPADEQSGGARAAMVADFIDATLAEAFEQSERDSWRQGLARVNALAREMHGAVFLKCPPDQRTAILTHMATAEQNPKTPEELFFVTLKSWTIRGYYTSKIGIHDEMRYLGNTYQRGDYAGELPK
jgi:hypothetical protein